MSTRFRMSVFCLGLGLALTFGAVLDAEARGKQSPTVQVLQDGAEATHRHIGPARDGFRIRVQA